MYGQRCRSVVRPFSTGHSAADSSCSYSCVGGGRSSVLEPLSSMSSGLGTFPGTGKKTYKQISEHYISMARPCARP